ncbi:amidohydrolase family protein [Streptomyces sp. AV19]|uniref:metal-dependent hydrolase family protein n=1 Tax=Streptomyces sp. AV19 TaxID=2793068 RepID=UPI0018FE131C|nr:amidohydrolase family protein [Streptomyces sp. AV19]MBH1937692.1 amidohydrolase family protein [Streptomyces sp. AV19]MDG4536360.1 amidohydrolase family protein [Streptomyces sp. AV19]
MMSELQPPPPVLITNARVFDGVHDEVSDPRSVYVADGRIAAVGEAPAPEAAVVDGGGRVLMPGLSDAHVHVFMAGNTEAEIMQGATGVAHYNALAEAERMLMRGFTTVRDMGGPSTALRRTIDAGRFPGPRIYASEGMVSQTSGHGDFSEIYDAAREFGGPETRIETTGYVRLADGRDRVLAAVREQLKRGANQIKVYAGGGVSSVYDPLDVQQFTPDELRAAVEAASDWGTYVAAHVYNSEGIRRSVEAGIVSIEHGHLASEETVAMLARKSVWLSTQPWLESDHHYPDPERTEKNRQVCEGVKRTYEWARRYGVKLAFGTDLTLSPSETHRQTEMFVRLSSHFGFSPVEALRMATSGNAELFRLSGERDPYKGARLGVIEPGAWADLLLVNGDPTQDLGLLADPGKNLALIMKGGRVHKNQLD